jgi:hypothetical protein
MSSPTLTLTPIEHKILREILENSYRAMHREAWDVKTSGAPHHLAEARERLAAIEALLTKCGSSVAQAMAPVTETPESI